MVGQGKRQKIDPGTDDRSNENCSKPVVYVRYKDHVLFKNFQQPIEEAIERETLGWLAKENSDIILVEHDRTIQNLPGSGQTQWISHSQELYTGILLTTITKKFKVDFKFTRRQR